MKALIFCMLTLFCTASMATPNPADMAKIVDIKGDGGFPIEHVAVTYARHCSQIFQGAWMQRTASDQVGLAITLTTLPAPCSMSEPEWVVEQARLPIHADVPTRYFVLTTISGADELSGVSVDSFD